MTATYHRTIRLGDTDAAGVVYFATGLSICHEAYETALLERGIDLSQELRKGAIALPIVHAEIDFFRPVFWGDRLEIALSSQWLGESRFEVDYEAFKIDNLTQQVITSKTIHVAIHPPNSPKMPFTVHFTNGDR